MKQSLLREAVRIAKEKLPNHKEYRHFPHYAFIITDKIVGWATNDNRNPPPHWGYQERDKVPKFHAEIAAWVKVKGLLCNKQFSMLNIRLNRSGDLRLSKPCKACYDLLTVLGCKKFYYSSNVGILKLKGK